MNTNSGQGIGEHATVWSLRGAAEFADVRARGRHCRHGRFVVETATGVAGQPVVLGLVVAKTVGNAVARNRVRRRVRAVVRSAAADLAGSRIVVRALPGAADVPFATVSAQVRACLGELGVRA